MTAINFPDSPLENEVFTSGTRSWKYVGGVWQTVTTATGNQGDKGGLKYKFDSVITMSVPDQGYLRLNNSNIVLATSLAINSSTIEGTNVLNYILEILASSSAVDGHIVIQSNVNNDPTYAIFAIAGIVDYTTWAEISVTYLSGTLPVDQEDLVLALTRTGDMGPTGPTGLTGPTGPEALPDQTGNTGKFLTTNGITSLWATVDALPSQTGNTGKYLKTDGLVATWELIVALPDQTGNTGKYLKTDGVTATWELIIALPEQTAHNGEFLVTNGTVASWSNTITARALGAKGLIVKGAPNQFSSLQEWQNSSGSILASMSSEGSLTAVTKSFEIDHPTKKDMRLRYGSLEGPENGVYSRGKISSNIINLPDYWTGLIDEESITVNLTPIGKAQDFFIEDISDNKVFLGGNNINAFYTVFAERKDVNKLIVEF